MKVHSWAVTSPAIRWEDTQIHSHFVRLFLRHKKTTSISDVALSFYSTRISCFQTYFSSFWYFLLLPCLADFESCLGHFIGKHFCDFAPRHLIMFMSSSWWMKEKKLPVYLLINKNLWGVPTLTSFLHVSGIPPLNWTLPQQDSINRSKKSMTNYWE